MAWHLRCFEHITQAHRAERKTSTSFSNKLHTNCVKRDNFVEATLQNQQKDTFILTRAFDINSGSCVLSSNACSNYALTWELSMVTVFVVNK